MQAELARSAIRTARIDWSIRWPTSTGQAGERTHLFTWRCAGDRYIQERWGDDEGVYARGDGYEPMSSRFQNPDATLWMDGVMWQHETRAILARVWNPERRALFELFDFRRLGLHPVSLHDSVEELNRKGGLPPVQYESELDGELYHVRGRAKSGDLEWWIDPARDWSVVRTRLSQPDGTTVAELEYELRRFDDRWFPVRVVTFAGEKANGRISRDIQVIAAEFNRPEHPQVLTPESIGIEPGTSLQYMYLTPPAQAPVWDGSAVVSMVEFYDRVRAGEAAIGPTLLRERARVVARSERLARAEGAGAVATANVPWRDIEAAWESYTRQVVEHYRLEEKQAEQAWRICADCQQQAREFIARHREKLAALDRVHGAPDAAANGDTPDTPAATDETASGGATAKHAAPERREELLGRIDEIFERRLKARLMTLPTDAQRAAAAKLPAIPEPRLIAVGEARRAEAPR